MKGAKNASLAGTLGAAIQTVANREEPSIKVTTRHYYRQIAVSLAKVAATAAATRYNGALALLRRFYERALESGHVGGNPPVCCA